MTKIVFTYRDGNIHEVVIRRPLTRALAEMYRIKYSSHFHDRGVVDDGKERTSLDDYIQGLMEKERVRK